jgi:hypothetical protein
MSASKPAGDGRLVLAAAALAAFGLFFGERLPVNNGLGWDGIRYAELARDLPGKFAAEGVPDYFVQRIVPAALVHAALRLLTLPLTDANLIAAFAFLSFLCVLGTAWLWLRIAAAMQISQAGKWFGFAGLFLNFAVARQGFYYPVLNDMTALLLGAAMLYSYLERRERLLALLIIVAYFTWVQAACMGLLLFAFPRRRDADPPVFSRPGRLHALAIALAVAVVALVLWFGLRAADAPLARLRPIWPLLPLSIALLLGYLIAGLHIVLRENELFQLRGAWAALQSPRLWLTAALLLAMHITVKALASPAPIDKATILTNVIGSGAVRPGVFLVAHAIYFGPVVLCAVLAWRSIGQFVPRYGPGLSLAAGLMVFFGLGSESRWLMNFLPLLVALTSRAVDAFAWRPMQLGCFVALSLFFSKLWLPLNLDSPTLYFINHGPWLTDFTYALQGVVVLLAAGGLWRACRPVAVPVAAWQSLARAA